MRGLALSVALCASVAWAHPQGFHVKLIFTLTHTKVEGLLTMDVDAGTRCLLLREAADANRDGVLSASELKGLEQKLVALATANLKLAISGAPLAIGAKEVKLSLRNDLRANDSGFSLAVLFEIVHPHPLGLGAVFELEYTPPDLSASAVEIFQIGVEPVRQALEAGKRLSVRLAP